MLWVAPLGTVIPSGSQCVKFQNIHTPPQKRLEIPGKVGVSKPKNLICRGVGGGGVLGQIPSLLRGMNWIFSGTTQE